MAQSSGIFIDKCVPVLSVKTQITYQQPVSEFQQSTRTAQLFAETDLSDATGASTLFSPVKAQIKNLFGGKTP